MQPYRWPYATLPVLHATSAMPYARLPILHAALPMPYAALPVLHATSAMLYASHELLSAPLNKKISFISIEFERNPGLKIV
jgi:hypothetical protein